MADKWDSIETSRPLRLMVVEDDQTDAELLISVLKRSGYRVTYDLIPSEAQFHQYLSNSYDAILCDHNLLNWTGMQALEVVRLRVPTVAFIVVTGTIGEEAVAEYLKRGADDYVLKSRLDRLPVVLRRALMERAKAEENASLHETILSAKQQWELTFDAVTDAVMVLDEVGTIRRANRATAELLGRNFSDIVGKDHDEVFCRDGEEGTTCPFSTMLQSGEHQRADVFYPTLKKTFDVVASPLRDASGGLRGGTLVMRDISDRIRLNEQLRQAQKMEAVGLLAGGMAHDFNNLLNVISGYAEILDAERILTGSKELEEIRRAVRRAAQLTSKLLAFGRRQVLQPRVLDLNLVIAETADMLRRLIGEDVKVATELNARPGVVRADQTQLEQILMNLATNSRDAMPEGGELIIRTDDAQLGALEQRKYPYVKPGSFVQLSVIDTGKGIPSDVMKHVFEPFFTTKEQGHGTGLGLAVVYGAVKQSGGYIWVSSEPNRGARFDIYLPRVDSLQRYEVEHIAVPTVVIAAEDDLFGTYKGGRHTAEHIPGARLVGYPTGGHVLVGHGNDVRSELARFLEVHAGRSQ